MKYHQVLLVLLLSIIGINISYSQNNILLKEQDSSVLSNYFNKCLKSSKVLHIAKKIFNYGTFPWGNSVDTNYLDHDSLFNVADSLIKGNQEFRLFYFHVLNESTEGADGAFEDLLESDSKIIIEANPEQFYHYINTDKSLSEGTLNEWEHFLCLELNDEIADGYINAKLDLYASLKEKLRGESKIEEWYKPLLAFIKNDCK